MVLKHVHFSDSSTSFEDNEDFHSSVGNVALEKGGPTHLALSNLLCRAAAEGDSDRVWSAARDPLFHRHERSIRSEPVEDMDKFVVR